MVSGAQVRLIDRAFDSAASITVEFHDEYVTQDRCSKSGDPWCSDGMPPNNIPDADLKALVDWILAKIMACTSPCWR
jgi:cytochrome c551/c552